MNRSTFLKIALASATPVSAQTQKRGNEFLDSTVLSHSYQIIEAPHKLIMTLPPLIAIRSILLLTGVPGSGKTTFLHALIRELVAREHHAAISLIDQKNAPIDKKAMHEDTATIASSAYGDGINKLCKVALTSSKSKQSSLLFEINGTADPIPLLENLIQLELNFHLHPRWLVCVIDSRHFGKCDHFDQSERIQLEAASHYYLSHSSRLTEAQKLQLEKKLKAINPRASRATASSLAEGLSQAIQQNRAYTFVRMNPYQRTYSSQNIVSPHQQVSPPAISYFPDSGSLGAQHHSSMSQPPFFPAKPSASAAPL